MGAFWQDLLFGISATDLLTLATVVVVLVTLPLHFE